jgi:tetratricopeptide (TPR) repeat protein
LNIGLIKWTVAIPIAAVLAWRIVTGNLADHYAQETDSAAIHAALNWRTDQPKALLHSGIASANDNAAQARETLKLAVRENPTEGRALAAIGLLDQGRKHEAQAEKAMKMADELSPQRTDVQSTLARYWMQRGDVGRALAHLDAVLRHSSADAPQYYPLILKLAEIPAYDAAFTTLLKSPLKWWSSFFVYASQNAAQADTVRMLYHLAQKSPNQLPEDVLQHYILRLQKEGAWMEAYFAWMNRLSKDQLAQMGNLYNGGFELPLSQIGFDWIATKTPQALIETASTYGITGNRALHVSFNGQRIQFRHLAQYLVLAPGAYRFHGRVRPDGLQTERGIQWAIRCLENDQPLTTSERFTGTDQWHHFSSQFTVPDGACAAQRLRLELVGQAALDFEVTGGIWFDDLAVEKVD